MSFSATIATTIPDTRAHIERAIEHDPLIFTRSLEAQMLSLLIEPLRDLSLSGYFNDPTTFPRLIIIDGLDECQDSRIQCRILDIISSALRKYALPIIFLIASRPEQELVYTFNLPHISGFLTRLTLDHSFHPDDDIRLFLQDSFDHIKGTHPRKAFIPALWPPPRTIDHLIKKSSGQFIYASTVVKFTSSIRHRPNERLEIVLGLRPAHRDMPFAELDALYTHIFSSVEDTEPVLLIISLVLLQDRDALSRPMEYYTDIEEFLGLNPGDVEFFLGDLGSVITCDGEKIHLSHASLGDFLLDPSRAKNFYCDPALMHARFSCRCFQYFKDREADYPFVGSVGYTYSGLPFHLSKALPTPDIRNHILRFNTRNVYGYPITRGYYFRVWVPRYLESIQVLAFEDSDQLCNRQLPTYDRLLKVELSKYQTGPPLTCLLGLLCIPHLLRKWSPTSPPHHLLQWDNDHFDLDHLRLSLLEYRRKEFEHGLHLLREFLGDEARSGIHAMTPARYAIAAFHCLRYLSDHQRNAYPARFTGRNCEMRRNSPLRWRKLIRANKSFKRRVELVREGLAGIEWRALTPPRKTSPIHPFPKFHEKVGNEHDRSVSYLISLEALPGMLARAGDSINLIDLARRCSFANRSLMFPLRTWRDEGHCFAWQHEDQVAQAISKISGKKE
ncbi:hypothetical protein BDZ97DRAFT_1758352 [Flammula alnicola]|nr:hypothetical protein BDZ97DRAFT_1758352 [Flammula alnicola]